MRSLVGWALVCVCVAGCSVSAEEEKSANTARSSDSIVGGKVDRGDPAVAYLFSEEYACTATLIGPTTLLTAAHCANGDPEQPFEVCFGTDMRYEDSPDFCVPVATMLVSPFYDNENFDAGDDIALAILEEPVDIPPVAVNLAPLPQSFVGQPVRQVGFGQTRGGDDDASFETAGVKRQVTLPLGGIEPKFVRVGERTRGTCSGDSGGPTLLKIDGVEKIIGVTSFGEDTCDDLGYMTRVDAYRAFVGPFVGR